MDNLLGFIILILQRSQFLCVHNIVLYTLYIIFVGKQKGKYNSCILYNILCGHWYI